MLSVITSNDDDELEGAEQQEEWGEEEALKDGSIMCGNTPNGAARTNRYERRTACRVQSPSPVLEATSPNHRSGRPRPTRRHARPQTTDRGAGKEAEPGSPRLAYNRKLRERQEGAMRIVNFLNMSKFRKRFQAQQGTVDLCSFIAIVQSVLGTSSRIREQLGADADDVTSTKITSWLVELFHEVDLDGDGWIVFEEFTKFVLDTAVQMNDPQRGRGGGTIVDYRPMPKAPLQHRRRYPYDKLLSIPQRPLIAVAEQESSVVHFVDMMRHGVRAGSLRSRAPVVAMAYIPGTPGKFITSHQDMVLRAWQLDDGPIRSRWEMLTCIPVSDTQQSLCYVASQKLLYAGSIAGEVSSWSVEERSLQSLVRRHRDVITDLLLLEDLDILASGSLDGTICLWDLCLDRQRQRLSGGHKKGVVALAACPSLRLLISAGYDHDALVWSPLVGTLLYRLNGQNAAITALLVPKNRTELVTGDASGTLKVREGAAAIHLTGGQLLLNLHVFGCCCVGASGGLLEKVWDLQTLRNVQSFTADADCGDVGQSDGVSALAQVSISKSLHRLVVATKRLNFYEQQKTMLEPIAHDLPVCAAVYNDVCLTIITAAGRALRVWDAILGSIKATYRPVATADVTVMCLNDTKRKILVGDAQGCVEVRAHKSGLFMKSFRHPTDAAVVGMMYTGASKEVVVAYADSTMRVFDESQTEACPVLRVFEDDSPYGGLTGNSGLNAATLSNAQLFSRQRYVATAGSKPGDAMRLWNLASAKCEAHLTVERHATYSVLAMAFLDDAPLLAVACTDGMVRLWALWVTEGGRRPCLVAFENADSSNGAMTQGTVSVPSWAEKPQAQPPQKTRNTATACAKISLSPHVVHQACSPTPTRARATQVGTQTNDGQQAAGGVSVLAMAWDHEDMHLYTGDERGTIRKWAFGGVFDELRRRRLLERDDATGAWKTVTGGWTASPLSSKLMSSTLVELIWSVAAHNEAINSIQLTHEPCVLLSCSADQSVKCWGVDGRACGALVKGCAEGARNQLWHLPLDAETRDKQDNDYFTRIRTTVVMQAKRRKAVAWKDCRSVASLSPRSRSPPPGPASVGSDVDCRPSFVSIGSGDTFVTPPSLDHSASVMTEVSAMAYHEVLNYLNDPKQSSFQVNTTAEQLSNPPKLSRPSSASADRKLRGVRMDMTLKALHRHPPAPTLRFKSPVRRFHGDTGSSNNAWSHTDTNALPRRPQSAPSKRVAGVSMSRLTATYHDLPPPEEVLLLPTSPGRKPRMAKNVKSTVEGLMRRMHQIDGTAPPPLFPVRRATFHDYIKDVVSPMMSIDMHSSVSMSGVSGDSDVDAEVLGFGRRASVFEERSAWE